VSGAERADLGSLSVDDNGAAMVSWRRCQPTCDLAVRRYVGGAWQPTESAAAVDVRQSFVTLSDEHALLFWQDEQAVWGRALTPAGWSAERRIAGVPGASDGYALDAVVLSAYGGVAAWQRLTFDTLVNEIITVRFAP
jgi:hypothetical protein